MNGKKTLPLLVIASLMLSLLPSVLFANAVFTWGNTYTVNTTTHVETVMAAPWAVVKGDTIAAKGTGAIAGTTLSAYWDNPNIAWNGVEGLLNSTTVSSNGAFDVWFKIPEAISGQHYLWLKDSSNNVYGPFPGVAGQGFRVEPKVTLSPSSGLGGDTVTISLYGYNATSKVSVDFGVQGFPAPVADIVTPTTNTLGTAVTTFSVPATVVSPRAYKVAAYNVSFTTAWLLNATATFNVGPVITPSVTAGAVGTVITVTGRGFTPGAAIAQGDLNLGVPDAHITTTVPFNVDATGRIRITAVIPQQAATGTYGLVLTSAAGNAGPVDFDVTALASISVSPNFAPVGSSIVITGTNFPRISGIDVPITMAGVALGLGTATTAADGTFSGTFTVPATTEGAHAITATAALYTIADNVGFKVGTMNIILSKTSSAAGRSVTISGNGFTASSTWNATFGTETVISAGATDANGLIVTAGGAATFQVPQLPTGTYTVTVWDETAEISLTTQFTITQATAVTLSAANAPVGFNVTLRGRGFSDVSLADVEFVIYNTTSAGATDFWWTVDVTDIPFNAGAASATNATGEFYGWWLVDAVLSKGNYNINATDADGYTVTMPFTVGGEHIVATSRKTSYAAGETISFNLEHSFGNAAPIFNSHINIYSPSNTLVFAGDQLNGWIETGDWYSNPYSDQTAGGNPMTLADDATTGTWSWEWIDTTGDEVASGNFTVTETPAGSVDEQIAALAAQITAVTTTVNNLSTTVASVATTATAASNAATAASAAASQAATAAQTASQAALDASAKSDAAKTAADNAAAAANGLTTLVYAAIGASLVAALAAIVALMQISRKIA